MTEAHFDPELQRFVRANAQADPAKLVLGGAPAGIDVRLAAEQIQARRKAAAKVPGWLEAADVVMPPPLSVEQASSALTAAYKAGLIRGGHLVDLTGGMGVDTLALAAVFDRTTYVEADAHLCRVFAHNAARLCERPPDVVNATADAFVAGFEGTATFFIDPARRDADRRRVCRFADCAPDVTALLPALAGRAERLLVKASPMIDLQQGIRELGRVESVHVVSVADEGREVLFLVTPEAGAEPLVHCVDLHPDGTAGTFSFTFAGEAVAECAISEPRTYLYDPATAVRKAGAFRTVAERFGLAKLAPSTHLYTSDTLVPGFPGRVFEVAGEGGKRPDRLVPEGRAQVLTRNHPLGAEALRRRYRLKDGGEHWLIGFRDARGRARTVVARRIRRDREDRPAPRLHQGE